MCVNKKLMINILNKSKRYNIIISQTEIKQHLIVFKMKYDSNNHNLIKRPTISIKAHDRLQIHMLVYSK